jgi:hypothetical protein
VDVEELTEVVGVELVEDEVVDVVVEVDVTRVNGGGTEEVDETDVDEVEVAM